MSLDVAASLRVSPSTALTGAEVSGVRLGDLDEATFALVRDALHDHGVLCFRDQHLSPEEQKAFGRRFGELNVHPFYRNLGPDHPEVLVLDYPGTSRAGVGWHSDATFLATPPLGSILQAKEAPLVGGDTFFANMAAAYEGLSATLRERLDGLTALHSSEKAFTGSNSLVGRSGRRADQKDEVAAPIENVHPVVRTHPPTGRKALFVNRVFTSHIVGMTDAESRWLIEFLAAQTDRIEYQVRFRWEPGTIVMWDNRIVQHAVAGDYDGRRLMHRVTVEDDVAPY